MFEPRKNHYVPICYLKQWGNTEDRCLCEHKLIPGRGVKPRRTSPKGTGYQVDLYRVGGVPDEIAQDFEKRFMRLVDTDASRAMEKIIAGETDNWPGELRSAWTRFIMSLLFRNPEAVATIRGHIVNMWDGAKKALQKDYAARRREGDPDTFEEFLAGHEPNAAQIGAANFLAELIDNGRIGNTIFRMQWSRIDLSKSEHQLLTSDRPIDMPLGLDDPKAYIALPVSPAILFVAAHDTEMADALRRTNPTEVARRINERIIQQARKFVWGSTDSQLNFINKHFGKLPDRELLTEQHKQEAVQAAQERPSETDALALFIVVAERRDRAGHFEARWNDRLVCVSREPFLDAARILLDEGHDPGAMISMRHAGSEHESLRALLDAAAKLTVEEGGGATVFRRFRLGSPVALGSATDALNDRGRISRNAA